MPIDAPTVDVLRKQAIAMAMLWLTARDYQAEGGRAWFHVRASDLGLRDNVLPGKRIRVTIETEADDSGVRGFAQPGQHTHADPRLERAQRSMDAKFNSATDGVRVDGPPRGWPAFVGLVYDLERAGKIDAETRAALVVAAKVLAGADGVQGTSEARIAVFADGVWLECDTPDGSRNFGFDTTGVKPADLHEYAKRISDATGIPLADGVMGTFNDQPKES